MSDSDHAESEQIGWCMTLTERAEPCGEWSGRTSIRNATRMIDQRGFLNAICEQHGDHACTRYV